MSTTQPRPPESHSSESDIDPLVLAELTRALLPYLGPYSITTVKRASRSTSDPAEAVRIVALHIDDAAKRELFLKSAKKVLIAHDGNGKAKAEMPAPAHTVNTGGRPATPVTLELMKRGETALAPIIGPLASVLVGRYSQVAENSRDFFEKLAGHLRNADEREAFFERIRQH